MLLIIIRIQFVFAMERAGRVELRDLQLPKLRPYELTRSPEFGKAAGGPFTCLPAQNKLRLAQVLPLYEPRNSY
jgi:hypothetical protein